MGIIHDEVHSQFIRAKDIRTRVNMKHVIRMAWEGSKNFSNWVSSTYLSVQCTKLQYTTHHYSHYTWLFCSAVQFSKWQRIVLRTFPLTYHFLDLNAIELVFEPLDVRNHNVIRFGDFIDIGTSKLPWRFFYGGKQFLWLSRIVCESQGAVESKMRNTREQVRYTREQNDNWE